MQSTDPENRQPAADDGIRFLLNGRPVCVSSGAPTQSLLTYLREQQRLTGTKEGCAEGDCGACTVVIGELAEDEVVLSAINACICFVPTLQGKAVFTVEYLRRQNGGTLHPVQQAMVDQHGSQCGFCTPGFVMSLWSLYNQHLATDTRPPRHEIRSALSGNLCRCTGYKPILQAAEAMFEAPQCRWTRPNCVNN
ncbi:MAG: 2Fe-2S iron-sulfur cluster-binding protein [Thiolinea sp.]